MKIQGEFQNQKYYSANVHSSAQFRNQNSCLKMKKTTKMINKSDRIKKSLNEWSHFEKVTYARLLLLFLVRNIAINQDFIQILSQKILRCQTQIIKFHQRMFQEHKSIANIIIFLIGYKITNKRSYNATKNIKVLDSKPHYNQVQPRDTIFLGQDEQYYLEKVCMIEKSPEFYEVNMQQSLIEVFDLDIDYQFEEDEQISSESFGQKYKYAFKEQQGLLYAYS